MIKPIEMNKPEEIHRTYLLEEHGLKIFYIGFLIITVIFLFLFIGKDDTLSIRK